MTPRGDDDDPLATALAENPGVAAILEQDPIELWPRSLMNAYAQGAFPMDTSDGDLGICITREDRPVIELASLRIPRSVRRVLNSSAFELRVNTAFNETLAACAEPRPQPAGVEGDGIWLTPRLVRAYQRLHRHGCAHSFEVWQDGKLVAGWFGVALGRTMTAESMFHTVSNSGTFALAAALVHLRQRGYDLVDIQMMSALPERLGAASISTEAYVARMRSGLAARMSPALEQS